jgi:hypothetical protein
LSSTSVADLFSNTAKPQQILRESLDTQIAISRDIFAIAERLAQYADALPDAQRQSFKELLERLANQGIKLAKTAESLAKSV